MPYRPWGGHTNTGGVSAITRTSGVMPDHVVSFDIPLTDGIKRTVARDRGDPTDRDLWFAVLGGSPGNFGVVTRITLGLFRNEDFPKTRGFKLLGPMSHRTFGRDSRLLTEMNDAPQGVPDFNLTLIAVGLENRWWLPRIMPSTFDNFMSDSYFHLVGPGRHRNHTDEHHLEESALGKSRVLSKVNGRGLTYPQGWPSNPASIRTRCSPPKTRRTEVFINWLTGTDREKQGDSSCLFRSK